MTATATESGAGTVVTTSTAEAAGDERLSHRGPIQRLLVSPEIGAFIGLALVWLVFWAISNQNVFGTAAGTATYLDGAAATGIMAVAVALLMIGGEFDLSSGALTGATGMLVILLVIDNSAGGAGLPVAYAIPLSLLFALAVGWFNGSVIERTNLPSFIVTLGSFFMLKGAKLGFGKLYTDKVIVEGLNRGDGYDAFQPLFASEWIRNDHEVLQRNMPVIGVYEPRDALFLFLAVAGGLLLIIGFLELTYKRSEEAHPIGWLLFTGGLGATFIGTVILHATDSVSGNIAGAAVGSVGAIAAFYGFGLARYERVDPARGQTPADAKSLPVVPIAGALLAVVLGVIAAISIDSENETTLASTLGERGLTGSLIRYALLAGLVAAAVVPLLRRAIAKSPSDAPLLFTIVGSFAAVLAFFVVMRSSAGGLESSDPTFWGGEVFRAGCVLLMLGILAAGAIRGNGAFRSTVVQVLTAFFAVAAFYFLTESLLTMQGLRGMAFVGLSGGGLLALMVTASRTTRMNGLAINFIVAALLVILGLVIRSEAVSNKFRSELPAVLVMLAVLVAATSLLSTYFGRRTSEVRLSQPESASVLVAVSSRLFGAAALFLLAVFVRSNYSYRSTPSVERPSFLTINGTASSLVPAVLGIAAVALLVWAAADVVRRFSILKQLPPDVRSRAFIVVGSILGFAALTVNMLYTTTAQLAVTPGAVRFRMSVVWFIIVTMLGAWLLTRTQFGNWIFAVGGNKQAARSIGVPAARTKATLFLMVSGAAWLVGMIRAHRFNSIQADVGDGDEFLYIIAAVVGGNLLTGGYGSAVGAAFGALIIAMSRQGINNAGFNSNWVFLFLGAILLAAVLVNNFVRNQAEGARK